MSRQHGAWALVLALAPAGCYQGAGFGDDGGAGEDAGDAAEDGGDAGDGDGDGCDADAVPTAAIVRMNRDTYVQALTDVFGEDVVDDVSAVLGSLPAVHGGVFSSETLAPSYTEVVAGVESAFALGNRVSRDADALTDLLPCLPGVPANATLGDDACLTEFVNTYGRRLLRRPLTDADRGRLAGDYAIGAEHSVAEGVSTLTAALLIDPEFLYFTEIGGTDLGDGVLALTPYETAARLARVLWNSVPDDDLLDAAEAGLDDELLAAQVERMLDDPRAERAISAFFYDLLELESAPFPAPPEVASLQDGVELREAMGESILAFGSSSVLEAEGTYADLLLDNTAYVDSEVLADIYGVETSMGPVALPDDERAGLLTRVGFLATMAIPRTNAGHIIKRGAKLSHFVCRPLQLPGDVELPNTDPAEPGENPDQGIRERFADATVEPQCWGCHKQMDAFGGPLGNYGSLGQWIETEKITPDEGQPVELAIDTSASFVLDGVDVMADDAVGLSQLFADSRDAPACFAEHIGRNMLARPLDEGDACLVESLGHALAGDDEVAPMSVRAALVEFVTSERFRKVKVQ